MSIQVFDSVRSFFLGGGPQLVNNEIVYKQDDRFRLYTETAGVVHVDIAVILKVTVKSTLSLDLTLIRIK